MRDLHHLRAADKPALRERYAAIAEWAINMIDVIDGDPDAELETDFDLNPISLQAVDRVPAKRITMRRAA